MKFRINESNNYYLTHRYYLALDEEYLNDYEIAKYLGLIEDEYQNILILYKAINPNGCMDYYFKDKEDAKMAIKELEPYLIIAELTK